MFLRLQQKSQTLWRLRFLQWKWARRGILLHRRRWRWWVGQNA